MPSENEMINQSGDNQPELNRESSIGPEPVETAVESSLPTENDLPQPEIEASPESMPESDADNLEGEAPDWDAWLLTNPEVEEIVSEDAHPAKDDIELDLAEVIVAEFEEEELVEVIEAEEALVELLTEVDELESAAEATAQADALETVAEAVAESIVVAEGVTEDMPEEAVETESAPAVVPVEEAVLPPPVKPKKRRKHPQDLRAKDVVRYFAPCGRCGYFLTGYRAAYGQENFETAVSEEKDGWLTLSWGNDIRELLLKSYGRVVESNDLVFNSTCPECCRALVYLGSSDADKPAAFRIEIKPESGN